MIKTIYFDLGNVLVFFSIEKMFQQLGACSLLEPNQVKEILFQSNLRERYEKGQINTQDLYKTFHKHGKKNFSLNEFTQAFSNIFTPNTELFPVLSDLKEKGIRLVLLSNTSESHFDYINCNYPILNLFDHKVLSYKEGVWKPDSQIFQIALKYAECPIDQCFYFDDIPEFIESAKQVGLKGAVFTTVSKFITRFTVKVTPSF